MKAKWPKRILTGVIQEQYKVAKNKNKNNNNYVAIIIKYSGFYQVESEMNMPEAGPHNNLISKLDRYGLERDGAWTI